MKLMAFVIYDAKAEAYLRPFFAETKGLAVRSFSDTVNESGHPMNAHAEDYTLFHVGVFDPLTADLQACQPLSLGNGLTFLEDSSDG